MKSLASVRYLASSLPMLRPSHQIALTLFGLTLACASLVSARVEGSGHVITETRQTNGAHAVELRGFGDLTVVQGSTENLVLSGEDNILPLVTTEVDAKGTLHISFKKGETVHTTEKLKFSLTVKSLDAVVLSGSGNVHVKELKGAESAAFDISLEGSGNIALDKLTASALKVSVAGSGDVTVAGETPEQKVDIAGSGNYEADKLKSKTASVSVAGSGDASVWATDSLDVKVDGSGDVSYKGKPTVKKQVHGSGSVAPLSEKDE